MNKIGVSDIPNKAKEYFNDEGTNSSLQSAEAQQVAAAFTKSAGMRLYPY